GTGPAAGGAQPRRKPVGASPTGGRSSRDESPKASRKRSVVPYSSGLPTTSLWPTTLTSSRPWGGSSVEAHEAPRAASSSPRVIGWWWAMRAGVSSAAQARGGGGAGGGSVAGGER